MKAQARSVVSLMLAVTFLAGGSSIAEAAPSEKSLEEEASTSRLQSQYTDEEILQLLFDGTGRVAEENPDLLERLNFSEERPEVNKKLLDEVIGKYLDYHKDFKSEVLDPLTSGDPLKVEEALVTLTDTYFEILEAEYGVTALSAEAQDGCGAGAKVCVIAYGAAFVNVAVYANAAVATMAVVALAVVPSAVSYLMAPDAADGELVKTELIANLTRALAA